MTEETKVTVADSLRSELQRLEPQFKMVLPEHISPEKFMRVVLTAVQTNPELMKATKKSLFSSCMKAAQDGLLPDGREAALTTYNTRDDGVVATYIPMIAGIMKKVRNSGELASLTTQVVYENDVFESFVDDSGEHLTHRPNHFGNRGKAVGAYAMVKTKDGSVYIEVMSADQIMAVRQMSKARNGPWNGPFADEMWRKTVFRRLSKRVPMSTDLSEVVTRDDDLYELPNQQTKVAKLVQAVNGTEKPAEPAAEESGEFSENQETTIQQSPA